jgi:hypothetical protein
MKNCSIITRVILPCLAISAVALFGSSTVWAQSGGNFVATANNTVCSVNSMNGNFNGVQFTSAPGGSLSATIKLPNSSPGLLVTPSLVTGMYTNTLSSNTNPSETAAIVVVVTDSVAGYPTKTLTPNQTCVDTAGTGCTSPSATCQCGTVYDERFQQLTTTGFSTTQSVDLILSTLSAHSFNFTEGDVPGGLHTIKLNWYFGCDNGTGQLSTAQCTSTFTANSAAACAGPENLTVQQVQNFQQDKQGIATTGP